MRVRAWIRLRDNPNTAGYAKGDIVEILPINADPGTEAYRSHYPVDLDLIVPCGKDFKAPYKCAKCVNNHPNTCDIRKYKTAKWSAGDVLNPPKIEKKRIHSVNLDAIIPEDLSVIAYKEINTAGEKEQIKAQADLVMYVKPDIIDKTAVIAEIEK